MIVLSKTFVPYEQFDLDIILKVTAYWSNFNIVLNTVKQLDKTIVNNSL